MTVRYYILEGDTTTAGGIVQKTTNTPSFKVYGKEQSYIGDDVWCPACQSMGKIIPDQDRLSTKVNGRMPALNDDLCLCKCTPPPKLVHSQMSFKEIIDDSRIAKHCQTPEQQHRQAKLQNKEAEYHTLLILVDTLNNPLKNCFYSIKFENGELLSGYTDDSGRTQEFLANKTISNIRYQINQGLSDE